VINTLQTIMDGFDFTYLLGILMGVIPSLICITLHELSHGLVAYSLGDDTAYTRGRLSLNPLKHLDPMGLLMMIVFHVGWAKPVPVNMYRFKNPKRGMAVTALAGPLSNILISVVFLFLYGLFYIPLGKSQVGSYFLSMIELTAYISIGLAVFNLLPVPPLDGSKILFSLISDEKFPTPTPCCTAVVSLRKLSIAGALSSISEIWGKRALLSAMVFLTQFSICSREISQKIA